MSTLFSVLYNVIEPEGDWTSDDYWLRIAPEDLPDTELEIDAFLDEAICEDMLLRVVETRIRNLGEFKKWAAREIMKRQEGVCGETH
jgi:hypothetical protein